MKGGMICGSKNGSVGNFACFSRPEMKVERVSYDVMTPIGGAGMLEAVYWHPGLQWHIDNIYVLAPIGASKHGWRNEVRIQGAGSSVEQHKDSADAQNCILTHQIDIVQRNIGIGSQDVGDM